MRIVKRDEFLKLPEGTVYMTYRPQIFDNLSIKWQGLGHNGWCDDALLGALESEGSHQTTDRCIEMEEQGASYPAEFGVCGRVTSDNPNELFAIYEPADVAKLIARLQEAHAASVIVGSPILTDPIMDPL